MPEVAAVVGVGASAGGVEALLELVAGLPEDLDASVLIVLHLSPSGSSVLASILDRRTALTVATAKAGQALKAGCVYVAPPDQHLRVEAGMMTLDREPRVNGHRPAVDPLLRSLAAAYGNRAIGVILSGSRDDGTLGLGAIKAAGGRALVQDPEEALYASMPESALATVDVDACLPLDALAARLVAEVAQIAKGHVAGAAIAPALEREDTRFVCPDCGGVLERRTLGGVESYACRIGHEYAPQSLADEWARQLESSLWAAVRTLEERADLLERLETRGGGPRPAEREQCLVRAALIREIIATPPLA
jgi:two-component system chemotaxis response regulator CheB